jgi:hypothetical protein
MAFPYRGRSWSGSTLGCSITVDRKRTAYGNAACRVSSTFGQPLTDSGRVLRTLIDRSGASSMPTSARASGRFAWCGSERIVKGYETMSYISR